MAENFTDFARTTLVDNISATDTFIEVHDGQYFPTANFHIVLDATNADHEIVWVVSRTENVLDCGDALNRGKFGTAAVPHRHGAVVVHTALAHVFNEIMTRLDALENPTP